MYDLIVIGGGPAGMMLAGRAAENGARVLLLEKNKKLGKKLLVTGNGRCNITHAEYDNKKLVSAYGSNGRFLFSALASLDVAGVVEFFESRGLSTKVEEDGRIFPVSDRATDVLDVLVKYLKENGVDIQMGSEVSKIKVKSDKIQKIVLESGEGLVATDYAICTGGRSYSGLGSSGDGYSWLKKMGHTIVAPRPCLVPVVVKEKFVRDLEGVSLQDVGIDIYQDGKKQDSHMGDAVFTANGMSGPVVLNMSRKIGEMLSGGKVQLKIDFVPGREFASLDKMIQRDWQQNSHKSLRKSLSAFVPKRVAEKFMSIASLDSGRQVGDMKKHERSALIHLMKETTLEVRSIGGFDQAIVTAGGVDVREVDPRTMKSKIINNLYLAGEILDIDGPTGGYNLQACWSSGYQAGENI